MVDSGGGHGFNVHTRDQDTVVTVVEGIVQILLHMQRSGPDAGARRQAVHDGESVTFSANTYTGNVVKKMSARPLYGARASWCLTMLICPR